MGVYIFKQRPSYFSNFQLQQICGHFMELGCVVLKYVFIDSILYQVKYVV